MRVLRIDVFKSNLVIRTVSRSPRSLMIQSSGGEVLLGATAVAGRGAGHQCLLDAPPRSLAQVTLLHIPDLHAYTMAPCEAE